MASPVRLLFFAAGRRLNRNLNLVKRPTIPVATAQLLRRIALAYPETEESVVCAKAAFKARGKSFLFAGVDDSGCNIMLKLGDSLPEATALAKESPDCYIVGAHGWVTTKFANGQSPPAGLFEKWIDESFRLLAPKQVVAILTEKRGRDKIEVQKPKRSRK